jgi:poly-gamma-glutamate capsule biosynthesis protein CapA/YwtB (metallophosphatase superfamily)
MTGGKPCSDDPFRLFLAGDALIIKPWSATTNAPFLKLVDEMRAADATVLNLETVIHEYEGYAQADCGGVHMASPPEIAGELRWAGVDMVSHANNHAFDYGSEGILTTIEHTRAAGLALAGTGKNLEDARTASSLRRGVTTVALVSMTASFTRYGIASPARPDMHGRPGVNPLALTNDILVNVTPTAAAVIRAIAILIGRDRERYRKKQFRFGGIHYNTDRKMAVVTGYRACEPDLSENLAAIANAAGGADLTIVAIHAHKHGRWLRDFAHAAIARGADIIVVHGPHEVRGIEIHKSKPIFHCMGDFVYQSDQITRLPAEAYVNASLPAETTVEEYHRDRSLTGLPNSRPAYEAIAAALDYRAGKLIAIRLLPVDLQFDAPYGTRGRPQYAARNLGRRIIGDVARLSAEYDTEIEYDAQSNEGRIHLT